ncbi:MAG: FkbM family methyltransferase [Proteobacteria bacterium]|nr:FkbM family methyltransferase [Pseudomonadota bacterium]
MTFGQFKVRVRDALPQSQQVPLKYFFNRLAGVLEPEMPLLKHFVQAGDRVIDVGGNRGTYTYYLWRLGAQVETFEPNPACVPLLMAWARGRARVNVYPVGLSKREGEATLHVPVDDQGVAHDASGSLEGTRSQGARHHMVELRTLDSFGFAGVEFIKIDVEGHERNVLEGGFETIRASHPTLLIEIEQRHLDTPIDDVFDVVQSEGYSGYFWSECGLRPLQEFSVERDQVEVEREQSTGRYINNFLFVHRTRRDAPRYRKLLLGTTSL